MRPVTLGAAVLLAAAVLGAAPARVTYEGSAFEKDARAKGRKLVRELPIDVDGDGKEEVGLAEQLPDGRMRLAVLKRTGAKEDELEAYELIGESSAKPAKKVLRLEAKQVAGRIAPELVGIFEDPSPDESALHVRILSGTGQGVREIFAQTFYVPRDERDRDPGTVVYGDATPRFMLVDLDGEEGSDLEAVWVREPQKLTVKGAAGPVTFVIGAQRTVYRYDRKTEAFALAKERDVVDFLPPKAPAEVTATAQVGKVWGTAQAFWATDDDLDTAWTVEVVEPKKKAKAPAKKKKKDPASDEAPAEGAIGQSLTIKWKSPIDLSMIRLVPGCGDDAEAWSVRHELKKLRLVLSSGQRLELDRKKLDAEVRGVRAVGEYPLDGGFGAQLLVFLTEKQSVKWVKLEILELDPPKVADKARRVSEACVSEISFH